MGSVLKTNDWLFGTNASPPMKAIVFPSMQVKANYNFLSYESSSVTATTRTTKEKEHQGKVDNKRNFMMMEKFFVFKSRCKWYKCKSLLSGSSGIALYLCCTKHWGLCYQSFTSTPHLDLPVGNFSDPPIPLPAEFSPFPSLPLLSG
eukprot:jgi/Psemu1/12897/gm1.12897_g